MRLISPELKSSAKLNQAITSITPLGSCCRSLCRSVSASGEFGVEPMTRWGGDQQQHGINQITDYATDINQRPASSAVPS
jgi:hypothetical protein